MAVPDLATTTPCFGPPHQHRTRCLLSGCGPQPPEPRLGKKAEAQLCGGGKSAPSCPWALRLSGWNISLLLVKSVNSSRKESDLGWTLSHAQPALCRPQISVPTRLALTVAWNPFPLQTLLVLGDCPCEIKEPVHVACHIISLVTFHGAPVCSV